MVNTDRNLIIVQIEDWLNSRIRRRLLAKDLPLELSDLDRRQLKNAIDARKHAPSCVDYINRLLREKGYVFDDGQLDCVRFYKHARISPDVWSTFSSGKHAPSKDTMMKIILALHLDENSAIEALMMAGFCFSQSDPTDKYIQACIDCGFYDPETVYEILEFYAEQEKGVRNIYGSANKNNKRRI